MEAGLPIPAYGQLLKLSHAFNILDARGAVGVTDRAACFGAMRTLARQIAGALFMQCMICVSGGPALRWQLPAAAARQHFGCWSPLARKLLMPPYEDHGFIFAAGCLARAIISGSRSSCGPEENIHVCVVISHQNHCCTFFMDREGFGAMAMAFTTWQPCRP